MNRRYYTDLNLIRDRQTQETVATVRGPDAHRLGIVLTWLLNAADDFEALHEVATTIEPDAFDVVLCIIESGSQTRWLNKPR